MELTRELLLANLIGYRVNDVSLVIRTEYIVLPPNARMAGLGFKPSSRFLVDVFEDDAV